MAATRLGFADRHEQLLDIAERLLADEGAAAVNMERVAIEAGIGKPVVYRHFRNRVDLLFTLLERDWAKLDADDAHVDRLPPDERLAARVRSYFDAVFRRRDLIHELDPEVERRRSTRRAAVVARRRDQVVERFGLDPVTAEIASAMVIAAQEGAARWAVEHPSERARAEELAALLTTSLVTTLRRRRSSSVT
jgi:AcrR family transcriptional regulator